MATRPSGLRSVKVPSPEQKAALERADGQIAAIRKTIAAGRSRPSTYDPAGGRAARRGRPAERLLWIDDAVPRRCRPREMAPGNGRTTRYPVSSGQSNLRITAQGLKQRFFAAPGGKLRSATAIRCSLRFSSTR